MSLIYCDHAAKQAAEMKKKLAAEKCDLRFAFIADLHYKFISEMRSSVQNIVCALNDIARDFPVDFVCLGGDNVGNYPASPEEHIEMMRELAGYFSFLDMPWVCAQGNHDDNSIHGRISDTKCRSRTGTEIPDKTQFDIFMSHQLDYKNFTPSDEPEKLYGYLDFPEKRIRAVILNGSEVPHIVEPDGMLRYPQQWIYGYSGEQLRWLAGKALCVPGGTKIILIQHIPFPGGLENDGIPHNGDVLQGILNTFSNGGKYEKKICSGDFPCDISVDFASRGEIITELCGHIHRDSRAYADGILHISTACAARDTAGLAFDEDHSPLPKTPFSETETCFDIFCVNAKDREITAVRYGVGKDRRFVY